MSLRFDALRLLSDGGFHSGVELGTALGVTRTAVWKHVRAQGELGLDIYAVPGKGYRLAQAIALLDRDAIAAAMATDGRALLGGLEIHRTNDSTDSYLMTQASTGLRSGHACLAEHQAAGPGRPGPPWISPYAANLYLSVLWRFTVDPAQLSGVGLAVCVALHRALRE